MIAGKRELRARLRRLRAELPDAAIRSVQIAEHVQGLAAWAEARTVMLYLAMPEEVDTERLAQAVLGEGKRLCVPRIDALSEMSAVHVLSLDGLEPAGGRLRILQPRPGVGQVLGPDDIDLSLVPCVGVDRNGRRLGLGGGHFDRFLRSTPSTAANLGLVFDCQVVDRLPQEPHDQRLMGFVTESGVHWTS